MLFFLQKQKHYHMGKYDVTYNIYQTFWILNLQNLGHCFLSMCFEHILDMKLMQWQSKNKLTAHHHCLKLYSKQVIVSLQRRLDCSGVREETERWWDEVPDKATCFNQANNFQLFETFYAIYSWRTAQGDIFSGHFQTCTKDSFKHCFCTIYLMSLPLLKSFFEVLINIMTSSYLYNCVSVSGCQNLTVSQTAGPISVKLGRKAQLNHVVKIAIGLYL